MITHTPAARPSTPSEKLTTFIITTSPTTVSSGPPLVCPRSEVQLPDERQHDRLHAHPEVHDHDRRQDLSASFRAGAGRSGRRAPPPRVMTPPPSSTPFHRCGFFGVAGGSQSAATSTPPKIARPPSSGVGRSDRPRSRGSSITPRRRARRIVRGVSSAVTAAPPGGVKRVELIRVGHRSPQASQAPQSRAARRRSALRRVRACPGPRTADSARRSRRRARRAPARGLVLGISATARIRPISVKSSRRSPRVASAGVPMRRPGGLQRRTRVERDGVAVDGDPDLVQPVLGLLPLSAGSLSRRSTSIRCTSVPPVSTLTPWPARQQLARERLGALDRALLALGEAARWRRS